jgi:hypothetical protein
LSATIREAMTTMPMMSWMMPAMKSSTLACGRVRVRVRVRVRARVRVRVRGLGL